MCGSVRVRSGRGESGRDSEYLRRDLVQGQGAQPRVRPPAQCVPSRLYPEHGHPRPRLPSHEGRGTERGYFSRLLSGHRHRHVCSLASRRASPRPDRQASRAVGGEQDCEV